MRYQIFYVAENGKRYFERVEANSPKEAEKKLRNKYYDITEIVQINEC